MFAYLRSLIPQAAARVAGPNLHYKHQTPTAMLDSFYNLKQVGPYVQGVPGLHNLTRKDLMALSYMRLLQAATPRTANEQERIRQEACSSMLGFSCRSYVLPFQANHVLDALRERQRKEASSTLARWINKPCNLSCGEGIRVLSDSHTLSLVEPHQHRFPNSDSGGTSSLVPPLAWSLEDFQKAEVLSEYHQNPFLIHGRKFDFRLYVALTIERDVKAHASLKPRAFLYKDGMARFATRTYTSAASAQGFDKFAHLTNYSVNSQSDDFNETSEDDVTGEARQVNYKWSFAATSEYLARELGQDTAAGIAQRIERVISNALLLGMPEILTAVSSHHHHLHEGKCTTSEAFFQLVGFDLLLTDQLDVKVIEVQQQPSLMPSSTFDLHLKASLVEGLQRFLSKEVELHTIGTLGQKTDAADKQRSQEKQAAGGGETSTPDNRFKDFKFGWREIELATRSDYLHVLEALQAQAQCEHSTRYRQYIEDVMGEERYRTHIAQTEHGNNTHTSGM
eukprot:g50149.t1